MENSGRAGLQFNELSGKKKNRLELFRLSTSALQSRFALYTIWERRARRLSRSASEADSSRTTARTTCRPGRWNKN